MSESIEINITRMKAAKKTFEEGPTAGMGPTQSALMATAEATLEALAQIKMLRETVTFLEEGLKELRNRVPSEKALESMGFKRVH